MIPVPYLDGALDLAASAEHLKSRRCAGCGWFRVYGNPTVITVTEAEAKALVSCPRRRPDFASSGTTPTRCIT